jgi:Fe-S-cluster containining protein
MRTIKIKPITVPRPKYDCLKCPGYCCSYAEIEITQRDIARLARHFGIDFDRAVERFTKYDKTKGIYMLRHRKDHIFDSMCAFFDQDKRRCTVYEARPGVCRKYPDAPRCGYYEFLKFEREQQGDPEFVAIT